MATRPNSDPDRSEPLASYHAKRDFGVTNEPVGAPGAPMGRSFVVQRHRATRLHYDLRLEVDGVLVSWAVPRGPTLDPTARRLAVHVEDHPLDYQTFEGTIPAGEYGGGDVIVWDRGTWSPAHDADPSAAIAAGELHFDLAGERLAGRFLLVRRGDGDEWFLIHKRDEHAVAGWDAEHHPTSVLSGRTNDDVTAGVVAQDPAWAGPDTAELVALDGLGRKGDWTIGGRVVHLTNLDKVLFPPLGGAEPLTKRDLVRHAARVAPLMLPYLAGRPVNLLRYPDGVEAPGFWAKAAPSTMPDWIETWDNPHARSGETTTYLVLGSAASLAWVANLGAVELNPWTSRIPDVEHPTWALIDIDPGPATSWSDTLVLARLYRTALEHLGVEGMAKVTGKRGIHIWIPVAPHVDFTTTRTWVERVSRTVAQAAPGLVSWAWEKQARDGLARLDDTQNAKNKTLVAPFSARPAPGAPVSVPIRWEELDDPELRPDRWHIRNVQERINRVGDPLRPLLGRNQELPPL